MNERERLRQERRSYILGSLLVLAVVVVAVSALNLILLRGSWPRTLADAERKIAALQTTLTWQQYFSEQLVYWAGGAGLFFLNFRFSLLLRRPAPAFSRTRSATRALWWVALFMNSLFYTLIFPQLAITWLLARWGSNAIAQFDAHPVLDRRDERGDGEAR